VNSTSKPGLRSGRSTRSNGEPPRAQNSPGPACLGYRKDAGNRDEAGTSESPRSAKSWSAGMKIAQLDCTSLDGGRLNLYRDIGASISHASTSFVDHLERPFVELVRLTPYSRRPSARQAHRE
jgi:hypothetical protein